MSQEPKMITTEDELIAHVNALPESKPSVPERLAQMDQCWMIRAGQPETKKPHVETLHEPQNDWI